MTKAGYLRMKYIADEKNTENITASEDNIVTRTYYDLAKRADRRKCFTQSLILLCVIFVLTSILGGLIYTYAQRVYGITVSYSGSVGIRAALRDYFLMFLPCALVFVSGFTVFSSLINGLLCAAGGIFTGFFTMELYVSFDFSKLPFVLFLVLYFLAIIYFSAISVSFSHRTPPGKDHIDGTFEDDLVCYIRYFALCSAVILFICTFEHLL